MAPMNSESKPKWRIGEGRAGHEEDRSGWKWRMKKCGEERRMGVTSKGGEEKGKQMEEEGLDFSSVNVKVKVMYNTTNFSLQKCTRMISVGREVTVYCSSK